MCSFSGTITKEAAMRCWVMRTDTSDLNDQGYYREKTRLEGPFDNRTDALSRASQLKQEENRKRGALHGKDERLASHIMYSVMSDEEIEEARRLGIRIKQG